MYTTLNFTKSQNHWMFPFLKLKKLTLFLSLPDCTLLRMLFSLNAFLNERKCLCQQAKTSLSLKKLFKEQTTFWKHCLGKEIIESIMRTRNLPQWKLLHGEWMMCISIEQKEKTEPIQFRLNNIHHKRRLVKIKKSDHTLHILCYFAHLH